MKKKLDFNNIIIFRILSCKIVYKHSNIENNVNLMKVHNSANAAMYFFKIKYLPTYLPTYLHVADHFTTSRDKERKTFVSVIKMLFLLTIALLADDGSVPVVS